MNKQEFLTRLREALSGLPREDVEERLGFYSEMIDDRVEDGLSEEAAVAEIGTVESILPQLVSETSLAKLVKERIVPRRRLQAWEIVLLVLGFPLWFPLLVAGFAVLLSVYVVLWALILSLWAVAAACAALFVGALAAGIMQVCTGKTPQGLILIAAALVLAGLSVFLFFGCKAATVGAVRSTKKIALGTKTLLLRKDGTK